MQNKSIYMIFARRYITCNDDLSSNSFADKFSRDNFAIDSKGITRGEFGQTKVSITDIKLHITPCWNNLADLERKRVSCYFSCIQHTCRVKTDQSRSQKSDCIGDSDDTENQIFIENVVSNFTNKLEISSSSLFAWILHWLYSYSWCYNILVRESYFPETSYWRYSRLVNQRRTQLQSHWSSRWLSMLVIMEFQVQSCIG